MKKILSLLLVLCMVFSLAGCAEKAAPEDEAAKSEEPAQENTENEAKEPETTMLLAAAASLKNCVDKELLPLFMEQNPTIKVNATYDSSGKLQAQIEEGADADVFMSAAMKQMNALDEKGLIADDSTVQLLQNKIVLIVPEGSNKEMSTFEDILKADTIAVGDPESVPAGQYAKEALDNLGIWDQVSAKASLGTNVTEVLNWVAEGSADAGVVYATDAASKDNVVVVAEAPEGSVSKIVYPVGMVKASKNQDAAKLFIEFLQSEDASKIFEKYGFTPNK
ncbi:MULTISPECIES: molybdate ABC transporter substrate-binding protein [unclassified Sedimentibacter]|uniref:molybdate ABC transporter substrate-binding protein n=1 Tax=unclassified Sedimentibacter TaxID=2649220 RepID=UPI0027DFA28B|nr:molybdate ABC transporter substrate-binding protein [Sedimentibacter sp. MB35-C1]WMJ77686.1 molybdate ABC transporter substrate-binding protein [Sedimentibacter sp. MB35-C1]